MRPLFTVHAGEFVVGNEIERRFPKAILWLPAKDTGVDLLVTNATRSRSVTLQVKYSRDFADLHSGLKAIGWFKLKRTRVLKSVADLWVFVLWSPLSPSVRQHNYIIIPPRTLLKRLTAIHGHEDEMINTYFAVAPDGCCWEARGLRKDDERAIVQGRYRNEQRDFRDHLNAWRLLGSQLNTTTQRTILSTNRG
jgi:hypothetical protein